MTQTELETFNALKSAARKYISSTEKIDWEQRRYEIAKAVLSNPAFVRQDGYENGFTVFYVPKTVETALKVTDELIKQLKGESEPK